MSAMEVVHLNLRKNDSQDGCSISYWTNCLKLRLPKEAMNQESNYFLTVSPRILYAPPRTGRGVRYHAISLKRWGCSSAGRARRSQRRGQGFDPPHLHQKEETIRFLLLHQISAPEIVH